MARATWVATHGRAVLETSPRHDFERKGLSQPGSNTIRSTQFKGVEEFFYRRGVGPTRRQGNREEVEFPARQEQPPLINRGATRAVPFVAESPAGMVVPCDAFVDGQLRAWSHILSG